MVSSKSIDFEVFNGHYAVNHIIIIDCYQVNTNENTNHTNIIDKPCIRAPVPRTVIIISCASTAIYISSVQVPVSLIINHQFVCPYRLL